MSHSKEREEKICLNCGTALTGRYCQNCGQQNTEPKETVWTLLSHFFNDITHFDGKFFSTGKYLLTKPGFLSSEYIKGRRASYLHPIRMYVFTSAFFFIIFFAFFNPAGTTEKKDESSQLKELRDASNSLGKMLTIKNDADLKDPDLRAAILRSQKNIDAHAEVLKKKVEEEERMDSIKRQQEKAKIDTAKKHAIQDRPGVRNVTAKDAGEFNITYDSSNTKTFRFTNVNVVYTLPAYDSVQKELPEKKKDGWVKKALIRKSLLLNEKYGGNNKEAMALFNEKYMHSLPQALFVSLPVFALLLLMLYARRDFYYADHAIFAIHVYCASLIILLVYFSVDKMQTATDWQWLLFVKFIVVLTILFYLYKAMRKFYKQNRAKTVFKFILLNISSLAVVAILFAAFAIISLIRFS